MTKRRSIGERLQRAKSRDVRREVALDWAANWLSDHDTTLAQLEQAIGRGRISEAGQYLGQLKTIDAKAISALPRVIEALTEDIL